MKSDFPCDRGSKSAFAEPLQAGQGTATGQEPGQETGRGARLFVLWSLILACLVHLPGCGGCGGGGSPSIKLRYSEEEMQTLLAKRAEERKKEAEEAKRRAEKRAKEQAARQAEQRRRREEADKKRKEAEAQAAAAEAKKAEPEPKPEPEPEKQKAPRPKELAQWTLDDFRGAWKDWHPRLGEAVAFLPEHPGIETEAKVALVRDLLVAANPLAQDDPPEPVPDQPYASVARSLVNALGATENKQAFLVMKDLLAGELQSPADEVVVDATLAFLLQHDSPTTDELLLLAALEPAKVRTNPEAGLSPEQVQSKALALIEQKAPARIRDKLTDLLVSGRASDEVTERLLAPMRVADITKAVNQATLYRSGQLDPQTNAAFEVYFAQYNTTILAQMFGVPLETEAEPSSDLPSPYTLADALWHPTIAGVVARRLKQTESLADGAPLLVLASSIPNDKLRREVYWKLSAFWREGPESLRNASPEVQGVVDPAFLVSLRAVIEQGEMGEYFREAKSLEARSKATGIGERIVVSEKRKQELEGALDIRKDWKGAEYSVGRAFATSFGKAVDAQRRAMGIDPAEQQNLPVPEDLPIRLHKGAALNAVYKLDWPADLGDLVEQAEVSPLSVTYVRLEEIAKFSGVKGYYKRQVYPQKAIDLDAGAWCSDLLNDRKAGLKRTVDIFITRESPAAEDDGAEVEQRMTIEIFTVEARDPSLPQKVATKP
jgi:hypothetical protein